MLLSFIKKLTGDKVSKRDFLFELATELREEYIVENSCRGMTIAGPCSSSTATKKIEPKSAKSAKEQQTIIKAEQPNLVQPQKKRLWLVHGHLAFRKHYM